MNQAPDLAGMMDLAFKHASTVLVEQPGAELQPSWCLLNRGGEMTLVLTPFIGAESKAIVAQLMAAKMREWGTTAYTFLTEAWLPPAIALSSPRTGWTRSRS